MISIADMQKGRTMNDLIEKLSNLRSQFNCFDENERDVYHTLSEAIKVLSERPEPCDDPRADVYYLAEKIGIHRLYALVVELRGEPEPCEDAVDRRKLLNDLGDLITAWKKYPVMAEQIKGVETAIKYVEMIPCKMNADMRMEVGKK